MNLHLHNHYSGTIIIIPDTMFVCFSRYLKKKIVYTMWVLYKKTREPRSLVFVYNGFLFFFYFYYFLFSQNHHNHPHINQPLLFKVYTLTSYIYVLHSHMIKLCIFLFNAHSVDSFKIVFNTCVYVQRVRNTSPNHFNSSCLVL